MRAGTAAAASAYACLPGLGDDEYPGFPADSCPQALPDLSGHHSTLADVLKRNPEIYEELRGQRTQLGVTLAKCIKTGIDNRGHPMIKTLGAVAGDEDCYEAFRPLFDALIQERHGISHSPALRAMGLSSNILSSKQADSSGRYVLSVQVKAARNLRGVRFSPACSRSERRVVERSLARALQAQRGPLAGKFYPLAGSTSFPAMPEGMSAAHQQGLADAGVLFSHPDSSALLCSGIGRHWPDARGVFLADSNTLSAWVNEEEHLRVVGACRGDGIQVTYQQVTDLLNSVAISLIRHDDGPKGFAWSPRLGFLTSCPSNLGTAMRVSVVVRLPLLAAQDERHTGGRAVSSSVAGSLRVWCTARRLTVRGVGDENGSPLQGVLELSNCDRLGLSEVETVNLLVHATNELVCAEQRLERGEPAGLEGKQILKNGAFPPLTRIPAEDYETCSWEVAGIVLNNLVVNAVVGPSPESQPAAAADSAAAPAAKPQTLPSVAAVEPNPTHEKRRMELRTTTEAALLHKFSGMTNTDNRAAALGASLALREQAEKALLVSAASGPLAHAARRTEGGRKSAASFSAAAKAVLIAAAPTPASSSTASKPSAMTALRVQAETVLLTAIGKGIVGGTTAGPNLSGPGEQAVAPNPGGGNLTRPTHRETMLLRCQAEEKLLQESLSGNLVADTRRALAALPTVPDISESSVDMEDVLGRAADVLSAASQSGLLAAALSSLGCSLDSGTQRHREDADIDDVRGRMRDMLLDAADGGKLDEVLGGTGSTRAVEDEDTDLDDIRGRMLDTLQNATHTGNLRSVLAQTGNTETLDDEDKYLRGMVMQTFAFASRSGALTEAFSSLEATRRFPEGFGEDSRVFGEDTAPAESEDLRNQVLDILPSATPTGALTAALNTEAGERQDMRLGENDREQVLLAFHGALETGQLDRILASRSNNQAKDVTTLAVPDEQAVPAALLGALSNADKRIGMLTEMTKEMQRRIQTRIEDAARLESEIEAFCRESASLDDDICKKKQVVDEAEAVNSQMFVRGRQLMDNFSSAQRSKRYADAELGRGFLSARSLVSTAASSGLLDAARYTPRRDLPRLEAPRPMPRIF